MEPQASTPAGAADDADHADLVRRIQGGDATAEAELVVRYGPGLRYLLRHLEADPAAAEDLHQETMIVALRALRRGELRDADKLPAFLRGTARNLARSERRRRWRWLGPLAEEDAEPRDRSRGPLAELLLDEEIELARRLVSELPSDRDREVLLRFCVAEEDKERICADLELSRLQFNLVLFRARRRFRELYERATSRLAAGERK
jgi:RNA polymerase sigma-70 factor (ECF subfamily)